VASKIIAVSDSGPLIHLSEINGIKTLRFLKQVFIPEEVFNETKGVQLSNVKVVKLQAKYKDITKALSISYKLDLGEAQSIALCMQTRCYLFLTDDLDARTVAKQCGIEVHGTIGLLVRAYRERIFTQEEVIAKLELLRIKSSLFLTKDLLEWSIKQIKDFKSRR